MEALPEGAVLDDAFVYPTAYLFSGATIPIVPFNVSRAYDEAKGLDHPRIWTAERDMEMWSALEKAD